ELQKKFVPLSSIMSDPNSTAKPEAKEIDPEQLARLLEIELIGKRAQWKQTAARNRSRRINTFVILAVLVAGCAVAFLFLFSKVNEERANRPASPEATAPDR